MAAYPSNTALRKAFKNVVARYTKEANAKDAKFFMTYHKAARKMLGIRAPQQAALFKDLYKNSLSSFSFEDQIRIANDLIARDELELKRAGIYLYEKNVKVITDETLSLLEPHFDEHVYDWATCDSFCGGVFFHLIKRDSTFEKMITQWKDAENLWRQRASAVSFVKLARHGNHSDTVIKICTSTVKNPERFVQLGTGWVLRELWLAEPRLVEDFLHKNASNFSSEGMRYAIEKMPKTKKAFYRDMCKMKRKRVVSQTQKAPARKRRPRKST